MLLSYVIILLLVGVTEPSPLTFQGPALYRVLLPSAPQGENSEKGCLGSWGSEVASSSADMTRKVTQVDSEEEEEEEEGRENDAKKFIESLWDPQTMEIEDGTRNFEVDRKKYEIKFAKEDHHGPSNSNAHTTQLSRGEVAHDDQLREDLDPPQGVQEQAISLLLARALDDLHQHPNYTYASRLTMRLHTFGGRRGDAQGAPNRVPQAERQKNNEAPVVEEAPSPLEVAERLEAEVAAGDVEESRDYEAMGCGLKNIAARILGGVVAQPAEWPWQGAVVYRPLRRHFCGASLINAQFVLTAAHCAHVAKRRDLEVWLGAHDVSLAWEAQRQVRLVTHVIVHEEFKTRVLHNDLALLRLDEPVVFSHAVRPICLPNSEDWDHHLAMGDEATDAEAVDASGTVVSASRDDSASARALVFSSADATVPDTSIPLTIPTTTISTSPLTTTSSPTNTTSSSTTISPPTGTFPTASSSSTSASSSATSSPTTLPFTTFFTMNSTSSSTMNSTFHLTMKSTSFTTTFTPSFTTTTSSSPLSNTTSISTSSFVTTQTTYPSSSSKTTFPTSSSATIISIFAPRDSKTNYTNTSVDSGSEVTAYRGIDTAATNTSGIPNTDATVSPKCTLSDCPESNDNDDITTLLFRSNNTDVTSTLLPVENITTAAPSSKGTSTTTRPPPVDNTTFIPLLVDNTTASPLLVDSTASSPHFVDKAMTSPLPVDYNTTSLTPMDNATRTAPSPEDKTTSDTLPLKDNSIPTSPHPMSNTTADQTPMENTTSVLPAGSTATITPTQPPEGVNVTLAPLRPEVAFNIVAREEEEVPEVLQLRHEGVVMGWGLVKEDGSPSALLQQVRLPFIPLSKCRGYYAHINPVTERMLCTLHPEDGFKPRDSCKGDSGGAIVVKGEDERWTQVGVISFGYGCGRPGFPGVYTRITKYLLWIYIKIFQTERDQLHKG